MKMDGVLKSYFGESNIPTPDFIKRAAQGLEDIYTFYTENAGLPGLRRDLAEYYQRLHGVALDPHPEIRRAFSVRSGRASKGGESRSRRRPRPQSR